MRCAIRLDTWAARPVSARQAHASEAVNFEGAGRGKSSTVGPPEEGPNSIWRPTRDNRCVPMFFLWRGPSEKARDGRGCYEDTEAADTIAATGASKDRRVARLTIPRLLVLKRTIDGRAANLEG